MKMYFNLLLCTLKFIFIFIDSILFLLTRAVVNKRKVSSFRWYFTRKKCKNKPKVKTDAEEKKQKQNKNQEITMKKPTRTDATWVVI